MEDIIKKLDMIGVPGNGLSWERIESYASNYKQYCLTEALIKDISIEKFKLSNHQQQAWDRIKDWVNTTDSYFVLRGYAGSGKSYLLSLLSKEVKTIDFTAPTNKATKVLSKFVKTNASTIYSLLGIRMKQVDDHLELTFSDTPPYFPKNSIIVVDECSMVNKQLLEFIHKTVERTKCKVLFVGDPAQLPPVGEPKTLAWNMAEKPNKFFMKQVIRYDNQLLSLATRIRDNLSNKEYYSPIEDDNDDGEGVFLKRNRREWIDLLKECRHPADFMETKVIAWRNKTVNAYNQLIRDNFGFENKYEVGDIVLIAEPVEKYGQIIATIDDEYVITDVYSSSVIVEVDNKEIVINTYRLTLIDEDEQTLTLDIPMNESTLQGVLSYKADLARNAKNSQRREFWKDFWDTKNKFHSVRYGYAITAHRAQGSTYETVFVDQKDIMINQNKREALRCLYVACTRPTTALITY